MTFDFSGRIGQLQASMAERGVDVALFSVGADMPYLIGYEAMPSERLTVLVVRQRGVPLLIVPELEAPRVGAGVFELESWADSEDPVAMAVSAAPSPSSVAVGDHMWSAFLIDFQERWPDASWVVASSLTRQLRMRKDRVEVETLRRAARGVDQVMERIPDEVLFSSRTERDVARQIAEMVLEVGHDTAEFTIVGSGPNGASPHHQPGDRIIEDGDLVVCDFGGRWDGYYSDSTRTFSVGEPSVGQVEVHEIVRTANEAAKAAVEPGVPCSEIDFAARSVIEDAGYGDYFVHRTGHGIGLEVHEHPYIVNGNDSLLEPGMTFSIEPGVYLPGRFGVRIEDIVVCSEDGIDSLNESERGLVVVE